jgi:hypothetical protein
MPPWRVAGQLYFALTNKEELCHGLKEVYLYFKEKYA